MRVRTLIDDLLANRNVPADDMVQTAGDGATVYGIFQVNKIAQDAATITLYGRLGPDMDWYQINAYTAKDAERVTLFPQMYAKITGRTNDTVTFTNATDHCDLTAHGMVDGDGPFQFSGADIPVGTTLLTDYFAVRVDDDNFKMATTRDLALAGTADVVLTDDGSGTIKLEGVIRAELAE